jgi:hypothetical protein
LPSLAPSAMPSGKGKSSKGSKKRKLKKERTWPRDLGPLA